MYSGTPESDFLQGDVLKGVPISYWSGLTKDPESGGLHSGLTWAARWKERSMTVILVSHSCDVTFKNAGKRKRVIVTPLQPVGPKLRAEVEAELGSLEALNRVPEPGRRDYLNLYHYAPQDGVIAEALVADFTILHFVDRPLLQLEMKMLQLDEEHRESLRLKIGFNFARPEEAEEGAGVKGAPPPPAEPRTG